MWYNPNVMAILQPVENHTQMRRLNLLLPISLEEQDWPENQSFTESYSSSQPFHRPKLKKKKKDFDKPEKWPENRKLLHRDKKELLNLGR